GRLGVRLGLVDLGDRLCQRPACELHAEYRFAEAFGWRFLFEPLRTGVLLLLVTPDAVICFIERTDEIGARIGERKAFAMTKMLEPVRAGASARVRMDRNEAHVIELVRRLEQHARGVLRFAFGRRRRPRGVARGELELGSVLGLVRKPTGDLAREIDLGEIAAKKLASSADGVERP